MLMTLALILAVLWLLGLIANVGGLVHLLLVIALAVLAYDFLVGRRRARL
ncbi:MAG TPA: lmo0937 family membrane protein [Candidatus Limnocylindrales bacterium]|nr:lmo0937 family membrane protein [Candidatus Limnocylindrales bacterium]